MKFIKIFLPVLLFAAAFASCDYESPLDREQYKKTLYMIGAKNNIITKELAYSSEPQETAVSVGLSGSLFPDFDVNVDLESHDQILNWYNSKYKFLATDIKYQILNQDLFQVPSMSTVIKAGEAYGRVPFTVKTEGLHCDSLYALTFRIKQSSHFEKNLTDSALIVTFKLVNKYSGNYDMKVIVNELSKTGDITGTKTINIMRTLTACSEHEVRFYNEQQPETYANIAPYAITLKVNPADNSVGVEPWDKFAITEVGACKYDPVNKIFTLDYTYKTSTNKIYNVVGTLTIQDENALVKN